MNARPRRVTSSVGSSRALTVLARLGFAGSALIHLFIGYLAIRVALNQGAETDQSGAIAQIVQLPGGVALLWIAVIGLFALALWLIIQAFLGIGSASKKRWVRSLVAAAKAVAYLVLGITALTFARGGSSSASSSTQQASSGILALPGGQLLLGLIGLVTFAVGVYLFVKGARQKFVSDIVLSTGRGRRPVLVLGTVGYVAKGIAVAVVGVLFVIAAVIVNPSQASGLDGALKALAALPFGSAILVVVGLGLIAFGIYTFARARLARL
ncbi:MAG TPA: DUF1206 domain-containing protein [Pseudolysinimonas sp.]|nr:DUF1206 domain-containing protein [Pseudolysinimonas sp.]